MDDAPVIRAGNPAGLVKLNRKTAELDHSEWVRRVKIPLLRSNLGGVLAVFDGDASVFPAGSDNPFCAASAARALARSAAKHAGAGKTFSLAVVFAIKEFETWLIAGAESFGSKTYPEGGAILRKDATIPENPEVLGKRWLEQNTFGYRPTRDQHRLAEIVDLASIRRRNVRSFQRLENAVDQLVTAAERGEFVCTPDFAA